MGAGSNADPVRSPQPMRGGRMYTRRPYPYKEAADKLTVLRESQPITSRPKTIDAIPFTNDIKAALPMTLITNMLG